MMSSPPPHRGRIAISALLIAGAAAGSWAPPVEAQCKVAFVTSVQGNGDLGSWPDSGGLTGLAGGDAICRARATAAGLRVAVAREMRYPEATRSQLG